MEKKATDEQKGTLYFRTVILPQWKNTMSKEEVRKAGYLPNEEVWNVDATYENQNLAKIELNKEVENQPTETRITKQMQLPEMSWKEPNCRSLIKTEMLWKNG